MNLGSSLAFYWVRVAPIISFMLFAFRVCFRSASCVQC